MKRIFDILFSLLGLILLFPLFILIGLMIRIRDGGPVFFSQKRIGRKGKPFFIHKFNSIRSVPGETEGLFGPGNIRNSSSLGRFLRKTKLNELPQLYNVLKGEMSFVGPRPEVEKWVNAYPERWKEVLKVRPGITDEASLVFLNEEQILRDSERPWEMYRDVILPRKLELYEDYVRRCCLRNDVRIILITLSMLLFRNRYVEKPAAPAVSGASVSQLQEPEPIIPELAAESH